MILINRVWIRIGILFCFAVIISVLIFLLAMKFMPHIEEWKEYGYLTAYFGVFLAFFLTNASVIIPVWGPPAITLAGAVASWTDPFSVAAVCAAGSALGEGVGYLFGLTGRKVVGLERSQSQLQKIENWFEHHWWPRWLYRLYQKARNHWWATILLFALTPLPFDLVGLAAGTARYSPLKFLFFCFLGKYLVSLFYVFVGTEVLERFFH